MITLQELLELRTDYFKSSKIKLVRHKDSRKEYKDIIKDRAALLEYQKEQGNPVFKNTDYIISFIGQEGTKSLLFGFFKVNGVEKNSQNNKYYYDLISKFKEITACPIIVNTSFNVRGEPIVNTPTDAFNCFMGTELDYLVIGNCILDKKEQNLSLKKDYTKEFELD